MINISKENSHFFLNKDDIEEYKGKESLKKIQEEHSLRNNYGDFKTKTLQKIRKPSFLTSKVN